MIMVPSRLIGYATVALVVLTLVVVGKHRYDAGVVEKAALQAATHHLTEQKDSLEVALKVSNTRVAHDTVVLNRAITRYVTARALVITDTVRVKEALAACDTVSQVARTTVAGLVAGIQVRDRTIVNRDSLISVLNARFPTATQTAVNDAKWALVGAGVVELVRAVAHK